MQLSHGAVFSHGDIRLKPATTPLRRDRFIEHDHVTKHDTEPPHFSDLVRNTSIVEASTTSERSVATQGDAQVAEEPRVKRKRGKAPGAAYAAVPAKHRPGASGERTLYHTSIAGLLVARIARWASEVQKTTGPSPPAEASTMPRACAESREREAVDEKVVSATADVNCATDKKAGSLSSGVKHALLGARQGSRDAPSS